MSPSTVQLIPLASSIPSSSGSVPGTREASVPGNKQSSKPDPWSPSHLWITCHLCPLPPSFALQPPAPHMLEALTWVIEHHLEMSVYATLVTHKYTLTSSHFLPFLVQLNLPAKVETTMTFSSFPPLIPAFSHQALSSLPLWPV